MLKKIAVVCVLFSFLLMSCKVQAQPFAEEIAAFNTQDSIQMPPKHAIVFTGSSSFRMWDSLAFAFPDHAVINRGFGGSTLNDLIHYAEAVIFRYQPKQVFIYCGDNDLASSETVTAMEVSRRFKLLYNMIRNKLPDVHIVYVSIKPSPSRIHLFSQMEQANAMIERFLKKKANTGFVDVFHAMLDEQGKPNEQLFLSDKLHMNAAGYAIWQKMIAPYLLPESR